MGAAVQARTQRDGLGDLLAVGADVLDRRGTHAAGDARERLEPGVPLVDREPHHVVPVDAGLDLQRVLGQWRDGDPAGGDLEHGAVEALVGHHEVAAPAQDQQRLAVGCQRPGPPRPPRPRSRPPAAVGPGRRGAAS